MAHKLSVVVPVYNEWKTIGELLKKLIALKLDKEIIVVNDGSSDGTTEVLNSISDPLIKIIRHPSNLGKGAAIRTALTRSTGDIVIIQDADLEQDPEDIYRLVQPFLTGRAAVVYGSRFLGQRPRMKWYVYWANVFLSGLASFLYGAAITDLETCYKVFRAEVIKKISIESNGFEFEAEVTAKLLREGHRILEIPVKEDWYHGFLNNSKKVTWKDGVKAVWTLIRYRL